ncbi:6340_t:CDS:2, partial [Ambispora leptoticha]
KNVWIKHLEEENEKLEKKAKTFERLMQEIREEENVSVISKKGGKEKKYEELYKRVKDEEWLKEKEKEPVEQRWYW